MIRHIVAWNLKEGFSEEEKLKNAAEIKASLEGLAEKVEELVSIQVVTNPLSTSSRNVILTSLFRSEKDLKAYQVHPEHVKVSSFVGSVTQDRICLDFPE